MDTLLYLWDLVMHLNKHLAEVSNQFGPLTYGILFAIIFCETGLVVTPFLPGDSLLFAAGALAAPITTAAAVAGGAATVTPGVLNIWLLSALLCIAAIAGDAVNYSIGNYLGPQLRSKGKLRFIKPEYLQRTEKFYAKYGKMTIILARFVPIVRTFAPFLAGVGSMRYVEFAMFNVIGGVLWVNGFLWTGYLFGNLEFVQKNFGMVILAIIIISVLPLIYEWMKFHADNKREAAEAAAAARAGE